VVKGIYNPLSRPLFLYVNRKSAERPEVKAFIDFYLRNGKLLAEEVSYIPLPDSAYPVLTSRFNRLNVGTGFGGHSKVGHDIDELLKIELKL
jgi:phosphate transport system substrate-binding protein